MSKYHRAARFFLAFVFPNEWRSGAYMESWDFEMKAGNAGALLVDWWFVSEMLWIVVEGWGARREMNERMQERSC